MNILNNEIQWSLLTTVINTFQGNDEGKCYFTTSATIIVCYETDFYW